MSQDKSVTYTYIMEVALLYHDQPNAKEVVDILISTAVALTASVIPITSSMPTKFHISEISF